MPRHRRVRLGSIRVGNTRIRDRREGIRRLRPRAGQWLGLGQRRSVRVGSIRIGLRRVRSTQRFGRHLHRSLLEVDGDDVSVPERDPVNRWRLTEARYGY